MKKPQINKLFAILLSTVVSSAAVAQGYTVPGTEIARPRSTMDLTRTDRLSGTPTLSGPLNCSAGQVLSGGSCITMSTQAYDKAWTSYFVGEEICASIGQANCYLSAKINNDGSISFVDHRIGGVSLTGSDGEISRAATPWGMTATSSVFEYGSLCPNSAGEGGDYVACRVKLYMYAEPVRDNSATLNGSAPTSWRAYARSTP